jgi:putative ABC transport system permease protein
VDAPVLLFGLAVTLLTGILFGLMPALQASRPDLPRTLKEGARSIKSGGRARNALVVVETALAVILLAGAGLLVQSFARLQQVDLGFRPESAVTFRFALPDAKYEEDPQVLAFVDSLMERMERLPGYRSAGAGLVMPLSGSDFTLTFTVAGRPPAPPGMDDAMRVQVATPGFFHAMGMPLVRGRGFSPQDRNGAPQVVMLNEAAVRRYFPGEDPMGKRITVGWSVNGVRRGGEVVGIVGDTKQVAPDEEGQPELYLPFAQAPMSTLSVVVRSTAEPAAVAAAARTAVRELDPDLPIYNLQPLTEAVAESSATRRFYMFLLGGFATVALLLAAVGIYGVISYSVGQRSQEIGIRMALGATRDRVLRAVVGQGLVLASIGAAAGLLGALLATRGLRSLLYEVSATDPLTFAAIAGLLLVVSWIACYIPARRAARVDPLIAMRYD